MYTKEDLIKLLIKTPIINEFADFEEINCASLDKYILENISEKGILLIRRYYAIVATK